MGRSFLSGGFWGVVVSATVLVVISQQTGRREILTDPPVPVVAPQDAAPAAEQAEPAGAGDEATDPPDAPAQVSVTEGEAPEPVTEDEEPVPGPTGADAQGALPPDPPPAPENAPAVPARDLPAPAPVRPDDLDSAPDAVEDAPFLPDDPGAFLAPPSGLPVPPGGGQTSPAADLQTAAVPAPSAPVAGTAPEALTPAPQDAAAPPVPAVAAAPAVMDDAPAPVPMAQVGASVPRAPGLATDPVAAGAPPSTPAAPRRDPAPLITSAPPPVLPGPETLPLLAQTVTAGDPAPVPAPEQAAPDSRVPEALVAAASARPFGPAPEAPAPLPAPVVITDRLPRIGDTPAPDDTAPDDTAPDDSAPDDSAPTTGATGATAEDSGVITGRLPRIGDTPQTAPEGSATDQPDPAPADALSRNAVAFDNPDGLPLVALVLLEEEPEAAPVDLPFPVSVALDPGQPGAQARAEAYAASGAEVLILPDLPQGAQARDAAVTLQDSFIRLPGAVAVIDTPGGALQGSRDVLAQTVSELAGTGHGLLTFARGLNTAQQVAARGGVTSALVFRDLDSEGQEPRVIKRFLDQAAFRARQEIAVILVARNRPETVAAITEWTQGNRAASIALAPVSAALRALTP